MKINLTGSIFSAAATLGTGIYFAAASLSVAALPLFAGAGIILGGSLVSTGMGYLVDKKKITPFMGMILTALAQVVFVIAAIVLASSLSVSAPFLIAIGIFGIAIGALHMGIAFRRQYLADKAQEQEEENKNRFAPVTQVFEASARWLVNYTREHGTLDEKAGTHTSIVA